ncbi:cell division FtsA domain-containing protein [Clostridium chauvoei]|uniref:Rod shape-determining protein n=2 Tax=Clostridium chauvoei TaxID=46867 RepID=A0ABD4RFP2_9CLOT|nr:cell division FtsA domain-containing protein [Clostridium chauvoei]ATD55654.1 cell division protein FtsA [Clostridium chauvoei]ATD56668.1 cell division protein FtsA [Clostridium chauvoei]MBX7280108.1 rod shape-determining protein [Clostridium chauvoei]MBX7282592.1 rod shape-determining protein [Clostridium chauvoei]MBX7284999.1 rod shape-determining protein [Clostridium chauvoei]
MNDLNVRNLKFALDIGTRSMIGTVLEVKDDRMQVICEKYIEHEQRAMIDGQIHDIDLVSKGVLEIVSSLESELNIKLESVAIAAAGRFLKTIDTKAEMEINPDEEITNDTIRSLELIAVKEAEEKIQGNTDGKLYCVGYSVVSYYLNGFVISNLNGHKGENISVEVISTFLPRSVVDSLYTVIKKVGLRVENLTLEPIAAIEAVVPKKLRLLNIALIDIGAGTSDIAISANEKISAYGMVPQAGDEVTEVIVQECLVDFNSAEEIKKKINIQEEITYTDVLGFENTIKSEDLKKAIKPIVKKIAESISKKIIELNGSKSPSALFLVGGGAHTPGLSEEITAELKMAPQRVAIKDRKAIDECISNDNLGSEGVTVLGIALVAAKNNGKDFIDVILNKTPITMFNTKEHKIMDVLLQAGINPAMLIAKNGKNIKYTINGNKRIAFGEKGENPIIKLDGNLANIEERIKAGSNIEVTFATKGLDAKPKIMEQIKTLDSISIYINEKIINVETISFINGNLVSLDTEIKDGDNVTFLMPKTIEDLKKYIIKKEVALYKNDMELDDNYEISDGEKFHTKDIETSKETIENSSEEIKVNVNGKNIVLKKDTENIFVSIFNYIDFDLKNTQGIINLRINGMEAKFTDSLKDGDKIEVFWS